MVTEVDREGLTPARFRSFVGDLMELLDGVGRQSLTEVLEMIDEPLARFEHEAEVLRYRGQAEREWLTAMGKITVARRTYRGDGSGAKGVVPLDLACGMTNRFMTPDVEEMSMYATAMVTPREAEQLLAKTLPEAPSATAIQNAMRRIGTAIREQLDDWGLSDGEADIAMLLLKGLSHREIAQLRNTSENTVRQQARALYAKSGLKGRNELSAYFLEDIVMPLGSPQSFKKTGLSFPANGQKSI